MLTTARSRRLFLSMLASLAIAPHGGMAASSLEVVQTIQAPCADDGSGSVIAVSPDGQFVYEGSGGPSAGVIRVSARNPATGTLTPVQYLTGAVGGIGLGAAVARLTPSPGWEHVYVSSASVDVFARDGGTGALSFVESYTAIAGNVAVSPDGAHVYVAGGSTLTAFSRNLATGALTELAQHSLTTSAGDVIVSPDGAHVYVSALGFGLGSTYSRDAGTGALTFVGSNTTGGALFITPDAANVYMTISNTGGGWIRAFARNAATGALTTVHTELAGDLGLPTLWDPRQVALSPDGGQLFAAGIPVVVFSRSLVDGSLTVLEQHVDQVGGVDGLEVVQDVAAPADGNHVYTIGEGTVTFARATPSGTLTFLGNRETEGAGVAVAVSPDGAQAYRLCMRGVEIFDRDGLTGQLVSAGMFALDSLDFARGASFSPDGQHLYVRQGLFSTTTDDDRLLVLERDPGTGALGNVIEYTASSFGDGFRHLAFSADGSQLYVTGLESLLVLARDSVSGMLALIDAEQGGLGGVPEAAVHNASDVVVSPDGAHVYVSTGNGLATDDGIAVFDRDSGTGELAFNAMFTVNGGGAGSLEGIVELAVSPDGLTVHAAGLFALGAVGGIATYARTPSTGALKFVSSLREGQEAAGTLDSPSLVKVSPAGTLLYANAQDANVHVLRRDLATGTLGFVHTLVVPEQFFLGDEDGSVTQSGDGEFLYAVATTGDVSLLAPRAVCSATPQPGCGGPDTASLKVVEKLGPSDLVAWKWKAPGSIVVGDPSATTELAFCVYDASAGPQPILSSLVEPGGMCGARPCWMPNATGYKYVDKIGSPDGVAKVRVLTGTSGTAKIVLKGKGASLPPLQLPYATPVTVQLQASNGECWSAMYVSPTISTAAQFKASQ